MSGYLKFNETGNVEFDAVLDAIERAGDSYHHTSQWQDKNEGYNDERSELEKINALIDKLAEQPTPSQSNDEYFFSDWWHDHHIEFSHRDIVKACELAFNAGQARAQLTKPQQIPSEVKAYIDRLEDSLAPFADCTAGIELDESDKEWAKFRLLVANYRQASQALASKPDCLKE